MRIKQKKKRSRKVGYKYEIYTLVLNIILLILITNTIFKTLVNGAELKNVVSTSSTLDSLTLVYNNIDASSFPCIVSLVTVTNEAGFIVGKLDENDFEVREDSVREFPIDVVEITSPKIAINVVLTIDRSGSMEGQPIEDAKLAAITFVELMQSMDQSAIVSFAFTPRTDYPFSNNKDSLIAAISKIKASESTAIFDALVHSVSLMSSELKNRAIILLTDGENKGGQYTYQQALNALLSHEVQVFTIGLGLNHNSPEESVLKDLASKTGGLYYYSPSSSDLVEIYKAISNLLHHRYQISYTTHNPAKDGTLRHVCIDVIVHNNTSSDTASYRAPYEKPVFEVIPNPFTPNEDGFNDRTEFRQGWYGTPQNWVITIMERSGRIIKRLTNGEKFWNGKDESGKLMLPGCYLYIVSDGDRAIHRGLIQLIR